MSNRFPSGLNARPGCVPYIVWVARPTTPITWVFVGIDEDHRPVVTQPCRQGTRASGDEPAVVVGGPGHDADQRAARGLVDVQLAPTPRDKEAARGRERDVQRVPIGQGRDEPAVRGVDKPDVAVDNNGHPPHVRAEHARAGVVLVVRVRGEYGVQNGVDVDVDACLRSRGRGRGRG